MIKKASASENSASARRSKIVELVQHKRMEEQQKRESLQARQMADLRRKANGKVQIDMMMEAPKSYFGKSAKPPLRKKK